MNIEEIREYCISKEFVEETFPFDQDTLVFKVMGKMFLLAYILITNRVHSAKDYLLLVLYRWNVLRVGGMSAEFQMIITRCILHFMTGTGGIKDWRICTCFVSTVTFVR